MKKVLILFGGNSYEHEISCMSVNFIKDNTDNNLFNYELVGIDFDNNWFIVDKNKTITNNWIHEEKEKIENIIDYLKQFNIVFPMIHGNTGEDGKLQGLFELYDIKYVGCDSYSSLICYDKLLTKMLLEKHDIPQIPYIIYSEKLDIDSINYPVIVKPCKCGSSIGISVVNNKNELLKAIEIAKNMIIT
jgi:D-alanine--D-alanine ligase